MSYGKNILLITASAFALSVAAPAFAQSAGPQNAPAANPVSPSAGVPADRAIPAPGSGPGIQGDTMNKDDNPVRGGETLKHSGTVAPAMDGFASLGAEWIAAQNTPARTLIGAEVVNAKNESIGEVEEVVNLNGHDTLVVSVGTFLGIGGRNIVLDLESSTIFHHVNDMDDIRILTNMTEEQLKDLPEYNPARH